MAQPWTVNGLTPDAVFRSAAGRIILTRWREMMSYQDGTLAGADIEELHAMRVSSRRLRAAMDAFADAFPPREFRRYLREVKRITDTLGDARDLDVTIAHLDALLVDLTPIDRPGVIGLMSRYQARREIETTHIASLFAQLENDGFSTQFEKWIAKHTGVKVTKLRPAPPEMP